MNVSGNIHVDVSGSGTSRRGPPRDTGPSFEQSLAEAEHRPLDFPAAERASYVRAMVARAQEFQRAGRSIDQIKELLPEFVRDYPRLFDMVTQEGGYDQQSLQTMLHMLDRMGAGNLNPHQASVIVGQRLLAKYGGQGQNRAGRNQ